jgi:hypothetical protein
VFTARYALSPYIGQKAFRLQRFNYYSDDEIKEDGTGRAKSVPLMGR